MKHAWLIIAHNEFDILQRLVGGLDRSGDDIFIHFDKKVRELPRIEAIRSRLYILDRRIDVRWGTFSQIECEMLLLKTAAEKGPYDYCHIISGTHLPLKPIEDIDRYFALQEGRIVLSGMVRDEPYQEMLKCRRYHFFLRGMASASRPIHHLSNFLWRGCIALQRILGIEHNRNLKFYKASNWVSLPWDAVGYIISRERAIGKIYRRSFCGDEFFVPSELMASPLAGRMHSDDLYLKCEMGRSHPRIYTLADLPWLEETGCLFARKFTCRRG